MLVLVLSLNYLLILTSEALDKVLKSISSFFLFRFRWNCEYSVSKANERVFAYMGETSGCIRIKEAIMLQGLL